MINKLLLVNGTGTFWVIFHGMNCEELGNDTYVIYIRLLFLSLTKGFTANQRHLVKRSEVADDLPRYITLAMKAVLQYGTA